MIVIILTSVLPARPDQRSDIRQSLRYLLFPPYDPLTCAVLRQRKPNTLMYRPAMISTAPNSCNALSVSSSNSAALASPTTGTSRESGATRQFHNARAAYPRSRSRLSWQQRPDRPAIRSWSDRWQSGFQRFASRRRATAMLQRTAVSESVHSRPPATLPAGARHAPLFFY